MIYIQIYLVHPGNVGVIGWVGRGDAEDAEEIVVQCRGVCVRNAAYDQVASFEHRSYYELHSTPLKLKWCTLLESQQKAQLS